MARFCGEIGYGESVEKSPGVWEDVITERTYYGDIVRNTRRISDGESVNPNITVNNSISVVADAYATEHFHAIRYIRWSGTLWTVTEVEVQSPRLLLRLGGVYHGPVYTAPAAPDTP